MTKTLKEFLLEASDTESEFVGIHYSHKPDLHVLHGSMFGTGIKGAEYGRLSETPDRRIRNRVYFYRKQATGALPTPEAGLGSHVYEFRSNNMYDATKRNEHTNAVLTTAKKYTEQGENASNAFERAIVDHGFAGYHTDNLGVVLNSNPSVTYKGSRIAHKESSSYPEPSSQASAPEEYKSDLLTSDQFSHIRSNFASLKSAAPSFRVSGSRAVVSTQHAPALKAHFAAAGLTI